VNGECLLFKSTKSFISHQFSKGNIDVFKNKDWAIFTFDIGKSLNSFIIYCVLAVAGLKGSQGASALLEKLQHPTRLD